MNKCDMGQLEVHDVEVCPLYYHIVPGRLVRSKKSPDALSVALSTNAGFLAKKFVRVHSPRKDGSGFLCFVRRNYICLLKKCLFYKDNHPRCNFPVKKLKLESLKFSFFRAVERQDI